MFQHWYQGYFIKIDFPGNKMPMERPEENVEIENVLVFPYLPLISELENILKSHEGS